MPRLITPIIAPGDVLQRITPPAEILGVDFALLVGDAQNRLKSVPSGVANTCLTSPPYWSTRDYGHTEQIGLEATVEEYVEHIVRVFREVYRVLTPEGSAWLNLGDTYLGNSAAHSRWARSKQLGLVPFRVAIALQEDGWLVRNVAVWHKPNAMPSSVRDRLTNCWEPVLLLAKGERYYFDLDAVRVPHKTDDAVERRRAVNGEGNGKAKGRLALRRWLNSPRHRASIDGLKQVRRRPNAPDATALASYLRRAAGDRGLTIQDVARRLDQPFERVRHYFRADKVGARLPPPETWERLRELLDLSAEYDEAMEIEVGDNVFRNHPNGRNPGDVQSVALAGGPAFHFAAMPTNLARWCLSTTLPPRGICLDPFAGSGTTGRVALALGARFLGSDLRADYLEYAAATFRNQQLTLSPGEISEPFEAYGS